MNWNYSTLKTKYKKIKRDRDFFEVDCNNKELEMKKLRKQIAKLEKENYELTCLVNAKIKEEIWKEY